MKITNSAPPVQVNSTTSPKQAQKPAQKKVEEPVSGVQVNFKHHVDKTNKTQQSEPKDPITLGQIGSILLSRFPFLPRKMFDSTGEKD
jgi:hypothetical protein